MTPNVDLQEIIHVLEEIQHVVLVGVLHLRKDLVLLQEVLHPEEEVQLLVVEVLAQEEVLQNLEVLLVVEEQKSSFYSFFNLSFLCKFVVF
jgi:hypothetical protein